MDNWLLYKQYIYTVDSQYIYFIHQPVVHQLYSNLSIPPYLYYVWDNMSVIQVFFRVMACAKKLHRYRTW